MGIDTSEQRGCFITLEGIEGAGKSSNIPYIIDFLQAQGIATLATREPGGTVVSEAIRAVLLAPHLPAMDADTELLLMFSARREHLVQVIWPALAQGRWVICDRFTDASYAYQGYGRGMDLKRIQLLEQWVQGGFRPDCTLLFDLEPHEGRLRALQRYQQQGTLADRFEQEQDVFFERVRQGYLKRAEYYPKQYVIIDAAKSLNVVQQQIDVQLRQLIQAIVN